MMIDCVSPKLEIFARTAADQPLLLRPMQFSSLLERPAQNMQMSVSASVLAYRAPFVKKSAYI